MPETKRHLKLRTLLLAVLETFAERASVGSEQFVYWNAKDAKMCLAPDALLRLGEPDSDFDTWRTWERGAPDIAVEIVSRSDGPDLSTEEKIDRYHEAGIGEVVRFDPLAKAGHRLRVWDRVDEDLVERVVEGDSTPCRPLSLWWVVVPGAGYPAALRLARDAAGKELILTSEEAAKREASEQRRGREAAEARNRELEAELARAKGGG